MLVSDGVLGVRSVELMRQFRNRMQGQQGNLYYDGTCAAHDSSCNNSTLGATNNYGAVYLLQSSPTLLCPYYHGYVYTDPSGQQWQIFCGYGNNGAGVVSTARASSEWNYVPFLSCGGSS